MKFDSNRLSRLIKKKRNGATFRQCAEDTGIDHAAIHRYENKKIVPVSIHLYILCQWLGVEMESFFTNK